MTQTEALKLALEALEKERPYLGAMPTLTIKAITAIKEALAQQCVCGEPNSAGTHRTDGPCLAPQPEQEQSGFFSREAMKAHSDFHVAQPEQEPVAWMHPEWRNYTRAPSPSVTPKEGWIPLYTTPPPVPEAHKRTWVGLDPEEIRKTNHHMVDGAYHYSFKQGAEWAEAKLKEKNMNNFLTKGNNNA